MIPILYDREEQFFTSNGVGRLADCINCTVTEERNSVYECEFQYPITGRFFNDLEVGAYVMVSHDEDGDLQPFEIYKISKPINGICTYSAWHLSYKLRTMVAQPFTAESCLDTMTKLGQNIPQFHRFTFTTDKVVTSSFKLDEPRAVRSVLGGVEGSVLDTYGTGEYEWDKWQVKLWLNRGQDTDVTIRYGKNLTDLNYDSDSADTYTGVVPFWKNEDTGTMVTLPEVYILSPTAPLIHSFLIDEDNDEIVTEDGDQLLLDYSNLRLVTLDLSSDIEDQPTVEELRQAAQKVASRKVWAPDDSIGINFVQLWNTEEYKDYAPLQHVKLCDTVNIYYPDLGITQEHIKVVQVVWDVLNERYDSMTLGEPKQTLGDAITAKIQDEVLPVVPSKTELRNAINSSTKLIAGGYGGYVYWTFLPDGTPSELMFLDAPNADEAVNVLRLNKNGIGFSHTGINGTYDNAWTIDGKLSASNIFGGTLHVGGDGASALEMNGEQMTFNALVDVSEDEETSRLEYVKTGVLNTGYLGGDWVLDGGFSVQVTNDIDLFLEEGLTENSLDLNHFWLTRNMAYMGGMDNPTLAIDFINNVVCEGNLTVNGTKNRKVKTDGYNDRLLYALETPSPMFADIGECVLDETGECLIYIEDIFSETVNTNIEYQVFLQKEGQGDCWVEEKEKTYFVIKGTPALRVAWELKAIQRGYEYERLEEYDDIVQTVARDLLDAQIEAISMYDDEFNILIEEGEELLDETA